jgi:hypothetical protein
MAIVETAMLGTAFSDLTSAIKSPLVMPSSEDWGNINSKAGVVMRVFVATLFVCAFVSGANASYLISPTGESSHETHHAYGRMVRGFKPMRQVPVHISHVASAGSAPELVSHPEGCPRSQFCGCGVSVRVFGHPVRDLWLVQNWYRFPRAQPASGNVAILGSRHVAYILEAYGDGTATLYDPNSGSGLTRVHRVSLRGWAVVDPRATVRRRYQYAQR